MKNVKTVEIIPDVSIMKHHAHYAGSIATKLMELIDNSIDARVPGKPVKVDVSIRRTKKGYVLEVEDNGIGMTEEKTKSFFQLGVSEKIGRRKIGRFGLGAKLAIMGLSNTCTVETKPYTEDAMYTIRFDIEQFHDWHVQYRVLPPKNRSHGTKITMDDITVRIGNIDRLTKRLVDSFAKTYKHYMLREKLLLSVNGIEVVPKPMELVEELYKEFSFTVRGKRVHGWAGVLQESASEQRYGFELINCGRIIKSNDFLGIPYTHATRLVGEVHLDDFLVDVHKTDFLRDDPAFVQMQETLTGDVLHDLLQEIYSISNQDLFTKYKWDLNVMSKSLNRVVRSYDFLRNIDIEEGVLESLKVKIRRERLKQRKVEEAVLSIEQLDEFFDLVEKKKAAQEAPTDTSVHEERKQERKRRERKTNPNIGLVIEEPNPVSLGVDHPAKRWSVFEKEGRTHVQIDLNLDHPMFHHEEEVAVAIKTVVLESVAEFITREERKKSDTVEDEIERLNRIKDMLIRHSFKAV